MNFNLKIPPCFLSKWFEKQRVPCYLTRPSDKRISYMQTSISAWPGVCPVKMCTELAKMSKPVSNMTLVQIRDIRCGLEITHRRYCDRSYWSIRKGKCLITFQSFQGTVNIYGVQPYYTVLETDGNAHSVALVNANAQEFTMRPGGSINYITIGGVLDFYFFLGPSPENTVQQYTEVRLSVKNCPMYMYICT